jgi:hypothetical protein
MVSLEILKVKSIHHMNLDSKTIRDYVVYSYQLTSDWKYLDVLDNYIDDFEYEEHENHYIIDGLEHRLTVHKSDINNWVRQCKLKSILND